MRNIERRILGFSGLLMGSIFMLNPQMLFSSVAILGNPSVILDFMPWYSPLPLLGLTLIGVGFSVYNKLSLKFRKLIWLFSMFYWGAWAIYFMIEFTPFLKYWFICSAHLLVVLLSIAGFFVAKEPRKGVNGKSDAVCRPVS